MKKLRETCHVDFMHVIESQNFIWSDVWDLSLHNDMSSFGSFGYNISEEDGIRYYIIMLPN
jgi:hypothetical protein